jgi:hypothetical protein
LLGAWAKAAATVKRQAHEPSNGHHRPPSAQTTALGIVERMIGEAKAREATP